MRRARQAAAVDVYGESEQRTAFFMVLEDNTRSMMQDDAPDMPDRGERYIALIHPFWCSVKSDLIKLVQDYNRRPATRRRILVEDVGRRLSLRGDGYGLDVTLEVERERLRARYTQHPPRGEKPTVVELPVDVQPDYLVLLDSRGGPISHPDEFLLAPLLRALT